jgi:2-polyprenyl-3-methyl-5-hydroxy-6-metoxy-1,4-benzoquinol methylase
MEEGASSTPAGPVTSGPTPLDHDSAPEFTAYFAQQSQSQESLARFRNIQDIVLRWVDPLRRTLEVADVGCGAGSQSLLWAKMGHRVFGVDVNEPLVNLAKKRSAQESLPIDFRLGTATALPLPDGSMDVVLAADVIEHVPDWQVCLDEFSRVLRPRGVLFVNTSNRLCPAQQEFNLPLYSWYPERLKRHYERLARSTRPELASHATYPAINWFTFYQLRRELRMRGMESFDRFDIARLRSQRGVPALLSRAICAFSPLRWVGHVLTPYTTVVGVKADGGRA